MKLSEYTDLEIIKEYKRRLKINPVVSYNKDGSANLKDGSVF